MGSGSSSRMPDLVPRWLPSMMPGGALGWTTEGEAYADAGGTTPAPPKCNTGYGLLACAATARISAFVHEPFHSSCSSRALKHGVCR
jgi:hypothetical protein